MAQHIYVADKAQVVPNQVLSVQIENEMILLYQLDGQYRAVSGFCTHQKAALAKECIVNGALFCPLHGASFDLRTGKCLRKPATRDLPTYAVIETGEALYVEIEQPIGATVWSGGSVE